MATQQQVSTPRVWRHRARKAGIELGGETLAGTTRQIFAETISRHFGIQMAACLRFAGLLSAAAIARASRRAVVLAICGPNYAVYEASSIDKLPSAAAGAVFVINLSAFAAEAGQRLSARGVADAD